MIYYSMPFDSGRNLGEAYNAFVTLLPEATDFACLLDADTMFTTSDYGDLIQRCVEENPSCRLFYARTNRIACRWQKVDTAPETDDIRAHRQFGLDLAREFQTRVVERQGERSPGSGFLILVRKDLWQQLGGFRRSGILGVDNDFYRRAVADGEIVLQMLGMYLYHWYKGALPDGTSEPGRRNTDHLRNPVLTRIGIINQLIAHCHYRSYLEIGVGNRACFNAVALDESVKVAVDPNPSSRALHCSSDEFFRSNTRCFDIVFIDGLHHADQVYRDIMNSLACLSDRGSIVCHDMMPRNEAEQTVPRVSKHWTGDCWKAWVKIRSERSDLHMEVVDADFGCGIIRRGQQRLLIVDKPLTWAAFTEKRHEWLNIVSRPTLMNCGTFLDVPQRNTRIN